LIAKISPQGQSYQYHFDARGSTTAVTDSARNAVNRYAYDPFGSLVASAEQQSNPFKYVGQFGVQAEPFNLVFAARRYYQPAQARFLSRDIAIPSLNNTQALNQYPYSLNNPITLIDPSGLSGQRDGRVLGEATGSSDQMHDLLIATTGGPLDPNNLPINATFLKQQALSPRNIALVSGALVPSLSYLGTTLTAAGYASLGPAVAATGPVVITVGAGAAIGYHGAKAYYSIPVGGGYTVGDYITDTTYTYLSSEDTPQPLRSLLTVQGPVGRFLDSPFFKPW
jgi:RHS repeat-associated protein